VRQPFALKVGVAGEIFHTRFLNRRQRLAWQPLLVMERFAATSVFPPCWKIALMANGETI
jgi:hypothetical protein